MRPYRDRSGRSGVAAYEILEDGIVVAFKGGGTYRYDVHHPGRLAVAVMKRLAAEGRGLSTYITRNVGDDYAEKLD
jgi:hypothetical protein